MTISSLGEFDERALIARIHARVPRFHEDLTLGIGDDAAIVRPARNRAEAITTDMLIEGVHFRRDWSKPEDIGAKAVLVNLSDLAAMGAEPRIVLLSLALPADWPIEDFDRLIDGVADAAREARVAIAGGNLTRSPGPLVVDITAMGSVHARKTLLRTGARPGDEIWVTGSLGAGAAGLRWLERHGLPPAGHPAQAAVRRACRPAPPIRAGAMLARAGASRAAIDLSDGLADGVRRLAEASGCGAVIEAGLVPVDPSARAIFEALAVDPATSAIAGGDDYELLFTVSPRNRGRLRSIQARLRTSITRIGRMNDAADVLVDGPGGRQPLAGGFDHFSS